MLDNFRLSSYIRYMIYLDYNATSPILTEVVEAMMPFLTSDWGNPSSSYKFGAKLKGIIQIAREKVAELIRAKSNEIIFTSCATESNNAAIYASLKTTTKKHVITSAVEHSSVLNYCRALEKEGYRFTYLPVDHEGLLNISDLEKAITDETGLVSLMWANNETGVLFPIGEIGEICQARGVLFHCDAAQALGKLTIDMRNVSVDYLSMSGHKIGAPKGVGALYVRMKTPFSPLIIGGHQERNRRGGTENVPFIVGLGEAAEYARNHLADFSREVLSLRDALENGILNSIKNTELNGHKAKRLVNTINITFHGIESEALLILLDQEGICASSGSACLMDAQQPSHVIKAMKPYSNAVVSRVFRTFVLDNPLIGVFRTRDQAT